MTSAERAEKLAKGLCFFCDQPYERGHKCNIKKIQLFLIEIPGKDDEELAELVQETDEDLGGRMEDQPQISMHTLSGSKSFQTMRVKGLYGRTPLHILIDSDNTHNFLDITLAKRLGCRMEEIPAQSITVADGHNLQCLYVCKGFKWKMHNAIFEIDMLIIPLGSCDVVLGIQWLSHLGTIRWDFKQLQMEFTYLGKDHVLRGMRGKKGQIMNKGQLQKVLVHNPQLCMLQIVGSQGVEPNICSLQGVTAETEDCLSCRR